MGDGSVDRLGPTEVAHVQPEHRFIRWRHEADARRTGSISYQSRMMMVELMLMLGGLEASTI